MISEETQERAALYALGLLDAGEAAAFERAQAADADLRALTTGLREAAAELARAAGDAAMPPALKNRVLACVAAERGTRGARMDDPAAGKVVVAGPWGSWQPWALAALLMLCCGALAVSRERWRRDFVALERKTLALQLAAADLQRATPAPVDALRQVVFCPLEPVRTAAQPRAVVMWDQARREGVLRVENLPPPGAGKDYQLWTVEVGHKAPVNAGVFAVGANGSAQARFEPVPEGGKDTVQAFAISLERAGGAAQNEGPILFLGRL